MNKKTKDEPKLDEKHSEQNLKNVSQDNEILKKLEAENTILKEKNIVLEAQNKDLDNKLKRALADYQNFEARVAREKKEFFDFAKTEIVLEFLPILDNLERAAKSIKDSGLQFVLKQFSDTLEKQGILAFAEKGETFDPHKHDCVEVVSGEENKIIEVLEKGFKLKDKIIKPAKVKVGKNQVKN